MCVISVSLTNLVSLQMNQPLVSCVLGVLMMISLSLKVSLVFLQQSTQSTRPAGPQNLQDTSLGKPAVAAARPSYPVHLPASPVRSRPLPPLGQEALLARLEEGGEAARATLVKLPCMMFGLYFFFFLIKILFM